MKKKSVSKFLALSLLASSIILPSQSVLAASADSPESFENSQNIESRLMDYAIMVNYSSNRGSTVSHIYTERKSNGDVHYFRGTLRYIGREDGFWGGYLYLGDKREFVLYKVVTSNGTVITPTFLAP